MLRRINKFNSLLMSTILLPAIPDYNFQENRDFTLFLALRTQANFFQNQQKLLTESAATCL